VWRQAVLAITLLTAGAAQAAKVTVPADVGVGPAGYWFSGPLLDNRGAIPHFALRFNLYAVIDQDTIQANRDRIPPKYRAMAKDVTELHVGPSIFIPSALYISPKVDALNGVGMFGVSWTPIGLMLLRTGGGSARDWNRKGGRFYLDAHLLLTYLYIYSDFTAIPPTHFIRPGVELTATLELDVSKNVLVSLGGGAQAYVPQKLGELGLGGLDESVVFAWFAFLKVHFRFPYEATL